MIKTFGRLRFKYGATLEDVNLPENFICKDDIGSWRFISYFKELPKEIVKRFSMIYLPEGKRR